MMSDHTIRRCGRAVLVSSCLALAAAPAMAGQGEGVLKVCADPANLPLSNDKGEGYENKIAEALAHDLKLRSNTRSFRSESVSYATPCASKTSSPNSTSAISLSAFPRTMN